MVPGEACFRCGNTAASGQAGQLRACGQCQHARYCGEDCQNVDWGMHKAFRKKNGVLFGKETTHYDLEAILADLPPAFG